MMSLDGIAASMPEVTTKPATAPPKAGAPPRAGGGGAAPAASFLDALFPPTPPVAGERQDDAEPGKALPDEDEKHDNPLIAYGLGVATGAVTLEGATSTAESAAKPIAQSGAPALSNARLSSVAEPSPTLAAAPINDDASEVGLPSISGVGRGQSAEPALLDPGFRRGGGGEVTVLTGAQPSPDGMSPKIDRRRAAVDVEVKPNSLSQAVTPEPPATSQLRSGRASEVFARALSSIAKPERRRGDTPATEAVGTTPTLASALPHPLDAGAPAQPTERALHRLVDQIERLRDDADAADTRIRLKPDALGAVDVSVRREGEAVHVHFTAQASDTRALLMEAQPRLEALAAERGVALAGTSVGGGGAQERPASQPQPILPVAPARTAAARADDAIIDIRIA